MHSLLFSYYKLSLIMSQIIMEVIRAFMRQSEFLKTRNANSRGPYGDFLL